MGGVLGIVPMLDAVRSALPCITTTSGQQVCTGSSSTGALAGLGVVLLVVYVAFAVIGIIAAVKVITKAGYSGWWVLITFIPIVGAVFILIFAFSTWPVTRELEMLRAQAQGFGPGKPGRYGGGYAGGPVGPGSVAQGPGLSSEMVACQAALPSFEQVLRRQADPSATAGQITPPGTSVGPSPDSSPSPTDVDATGPAAGWYPAPGGRPGQLRYWDGTAWTNHLH